jgi:hypothetical protein
MNLFGLNRQAQKPVHQSSPLNRRSFLLGTGTALFSAPALSQLAQAQETKTLKDKLCNEEPQKCLEKFLELILDDPSIKGQVTKDHFQIVSGLNQEKDGLTELYQEAKKQAEKQNLPQERLNRITGELLINLIVNQKNQTESTVQSFNIGSLEKQKKLFVVPFGPNTTNANSPFEAVQRMISETLMMIEVQKAVKDFKAKNPNKDPEKMPNLLIPVVEHLEKAKALSESISKTIAEKHGKSEPLLKELKDEVINSFEKQIEEMKALEKKIQKQLQNRFNPQGQELALDQKLQQSSTIVANNKNTSSWQNFI